MKHWSFPASWFASGSKILHASFALWSRRPSGKYTEWNKLEWTNDLHLHKKNNKKTIRALLDVNLCFSWQKHFRAMKFLHTMVKEEFTEDSKATRDGISKPAPETTEERKSQGKKGTMRKYRVLCPFLISKRNLMPRQAAKASRENIRIATLQKTRTLFRMLRNLRRRRRRRSMRRKM